MATVMLLLRMPSPAAAENELTVADVQSVTGLANVKQVSKGSTPGAGGTLNFVRADGKLLLVVTIGQASDYDEAKTAFEKRTAVSGLGDEAFTPTNYPWALYARKASKLVGIGSGLDPQTGKQILTGTQMKEIASRVLGRLGTL